MMNFPEFLSPYQADLEKYKMETVLINATPIANGESLSITQSKFLGLPFLPVGVDYPEDSKGTPMILLAQINFSELPSLPEYPSEGILQLFVSPDDWYDMEEYAVLYHEDLTQEHQKDFSFLTDDFYLDSPILSEHALQFEKSVEYGGVADERFDYMFGEQDYWDFEESLAEEDAKQLGTFFTSGGSKVGGYAYFTQQDVRSYSPSKKNDLLLLQIDSDEKIMFGDSGVANVFINPDDLKKKDFSKAYFYWDCY
ncbi:YwqG family protein [Siphonobacter sp. SORGH_AS_0500]|uniref:YwqG family protein n=1 Tax=Siphonobacter sp. SORGH_AS_0500 TaxID=1864824 RepID=UPI000CA6D872|nr:YwqG family protein [Siphonobacter sp. SORGH_AS_0500]MDR6195402.1 uncharacterized protein YwqG [Siphonobacter sp. SORGH_AS_0500]PKK34885.1 hypothetical protein BWI96_19960 [Siphonobacter sp. SORGH_AS_0500]